MAKPKILFIDIESLPNICYAYDLFSYKSYKMIKQEKTIISFAWKWMDEKHTNVVTAKVPYKDADVCKVINEQLAKADYVVAHYGDKFDLKFIRSRTLLNGLIATSPTATIDTYKLAKKYFNFNANRLDYLGKLFGLGEKIPTTFELWAKCAEGNKKAIKQMAEYNKQDVVLLEKVFKWMLPHVDAKINYNLFNEHDEHSCPTCGSMQLQKRGTIVNKVTKRQRMMCMKCGSWHSVKEA